MATPRPRKPVCVCGWVRVRDIWVRGRVRVRARIRVGDIWVG